MVVGVSSFPPCQPPRTDVAQSAVLSAENKEAISKFIKSSVQPSTDRKYEVQWTWFVDFVKEKTGSEDPFMRGLDQQEKAAMVSLFMISRYVTGKRGKAATAATAAIRLRYSQEMLDTAFLDSAVVSTSRTACLLNPGELRERRNSAPASSVKLPVCEEIIASMRKRLVEGRTWCEADMKHIMTYLGCMYGFEFAARLSEYTKPERGLTDHCVRTDDLTFAGTSPTGDFSVVGSALVDLPLAIAGEGYSNVKFCFVRGVTTKSKITVKAKALSRRSPEESLFMDDLIQFIIHARALGKEELLSFRKANGDRVVLSGRSVRDEVKSTCKTFGLDPEYFSAHSLRKGAITHMRAQGTSVDDRLDRGNYAPNSQVMSLVYDQSMGLGPLGSNSLEGGHRPDVTDVKRLLPAKRRSV